MSDASPAADRDAWVLTFAYWGTLLLAGCLFAAVALAPKLKTLAELDDRYAVNQYRLVELERQTQELARVSESLEKDPAFAAQLAMFEFSAGRAGEERIAMPPDLQLGAVVEEPDLAPTRRVTPPALPRWLVESLATQHGLRITLLSASALIAIFALLVLHESQIAAVRSTCERIARLSRTVTDRYRRA